MEINEDVIADGSLKASGNLAVKGTATLTGAVSAPGGVTGPVGLLQGGLATYSIPTDANATLPVANASACILEITSGVSLTATRTLTLPGTAGLEYTVHNGTTGAQSITLAAATGTGITVATGKRACIYFDGTNYVRATADT